MAQAEAETAGAAAEEAPLRTAFVTGGSGFLGRNLIRALRARGVRVAALARSVHAGHTVEVAGADAVMARTHARTRVPLLLALLRRT
jgi:nucleoside-diphosphate-sugar epimerase